MPVITSEKLEKKITTIVKAAEGAWLSVTQIVERLAVGHGVIAHSTDVVFCIMHLENEGKLESRQMDDGEVITKA